MAPDRRASEGALGAVQPNPIIVLLESPAGNRIFATVGDRNRGLVLGAIRGFMQLAVWAAGFDSVDLDFMSSLVSARVGANRSIVCRPSVGDS